MVNRILDWLGVAFFLAMVPFMPLTWLVMYVVMERLGLIGL
jgi:hypothetical protein